MSKSEIIGVPSNNTGALGHYDVSLFQWKDFIYLFIYFCFLGLHPRHMEVPRLGVESEL